MVRNPPWKAADGEGGQAPLLAASSDSTRNRHPSPFSKTTPNTQEGFSMCLFFFSLIPSRSFQPTEISGRTHPFLPRWDEAGTTHFQHPRVGKIQYGDAPRGAPCSRTVSRRGKPGGFGRERFLRLQPTPEPETRGRSPSPSLPTLPRTPALPPSPGTPYFHATGDRGRRSGAPTGTTFKLLHPISSTPLPPTIPADPPPARLSLYHPRRGLQRPPGPGLGPFPRRPGGPRSRDAGWGGGGGGRRRGKEEKGICAISSPPLPAPCSGCGEAECRR